MYQFTFQEKFNRAEIVDSDWILKYGKKSGKPEIGGWQTFAYKANTVVYFFRQYTVNFVTGSDGAWNFLLSQDIVEDQLVS